MQPNLTVVTLFIRMFNIKQTSYEIRCEKHWDNVVNEILIYSKNSSNFWKHELVIEYFLIYSHKYEHEKVFANSTSSHVKCFAGCCYDWGCKK